MNPEKYGYILEETTPEQIVPKQEPSPAPQETPSEQPAEPSQPPVELDDSFSKEQQDAAAGNVTENTDELSAEDTGDANQNINTEEPVDEQPVENDVTNDSIQQ